MAQAGNIEYVATDENTQFTAAILQNAAAYLDLALPQSIAAGRTCRSRLRGLTIVSVQNLGWDLWLFTRKRTGAEAVGDIRFRGLWQFSSVMAFQIGGAGLYYYYIDGLDVPYEADDLRVDGGPDEDLRKYLHLALVAREGAKLANAAGAVRVAVALEGTLGW